MKAEKKQAQSGEGSKKEADCVEIKVQVLSLAERRDPSQGAGVTIMAVAWDDINEHLESLRPNLHLLPATLRILQG